MRTTLSTACRFVREVEPPELVDGSFALRCRELISTNSQPLMLEIENCAARDGGMVDRLSVAVCDWLGWSTALDPTRPIGAPRFKPKPPDDMEAFRLLDET